MAQGRSTGVTFTQQVKVVKKNLEEVVPIFMKKVSEEVVRLSPVLSGEYVRSHKISAAASGGGRFAGRFRKNVASPNPEGEKAQALESLYSQIESLPKTVATVSLTNDTPHSYKVEYAGWGSTPPYMVYATTKSRARQLLKDAVNEVGFR